MTDTYQSILREGCFADRVVVVTGGGSGIGRCVAHELASLGARVVVTGRKQEKLDAVAAEITEDGGRVSTEAFDIREEEAVTAAIARILQREGAIHGLVNNAGGQYPALLEGISQKGFETVVRTNLVGGFLVARECFTQYMKAHGGAVVNVTADFWDGMAGMGHSGAARAGMDNFTRTAAVEWAASGVRVNAVAPGWIASSGLDTYDDDLTRAMLPELKKHVPLKRLATEAEVSAVICFLLSDGAAFVSGANVPIDGAASQGRPIFPLAQAKNVAVFQGFHRYRAPRAIDEKG